jgi:hypothetical protein
MQCKQQSPAMPSWVSIFGHFPGVFPCELLNLHRLRRIDLRWNDALAESHPMREALPASGELKGARFNDGNVVTEPAPRGTEFLLRYTHDEAWGADEPDSHGSARVDPGLMHLCGVVVLTKRLQPQNSIRAFVGHEFQVLPHILLMFQLSRRPRGSSAHGPQWIRSPVSSHG